MSLAVVLSQYGMRPATPIVTPVGVTAAGAVHYEITTIGDQGLRGDVTDAMLSLASGVTSLSSSSSAARECDRTCGPAIVSHHWPCLASSGVPSAAKAIQALNRNHQAGMRAHEVTGRCRRSECDWRKV